MFRKVKESLLINTLASPSEQNNIDQGEPLKKKLKVDESLVFYSEVDSHVIEKLKQLNIYVPQKAGPIQLRAILKAALKK